MKFHDRYEWIDYLKAQKTAQRIVADPSMIDDAKQLVERWMAPDPHQRTYAEMWRALLARPVAEIAAALVEDGPRGRLVRETRPVFGRG